jgi:hypothetical protein
MSEDDVLFGYRLQLFDYVARTLASEACRVFGVHRSSYYRAGPPHGGTRVDASQGVKVSTDPGQPAPPGVSLRAWAIR